MQSVNDQTSSMNMNYSPSGLGKAILFLQPVFTNSLSQRALHSMSIITTSSSLKPSHRLSKNSQENQGEKLQLVQTGGGAVENIWKHRETARRQGQTTRCEKIGRASCRERVYSNLLHSILNRLLQPTLCTDGFSLCSWQLQQSF